MSHIDNLREIKKHKYACRDCMEEGYLKALKETKKQGDKGLSYNTIFDDIEEAIKEAENGE